MRGAAPGAGQEDAEPNTALIAVPPAAEERAASEFDGPVARLPVEIDVAVPVRNLRVRNLLALVPGELIASRWRSGDDFPLSAGEVPVAWIEFEVMDGQLAVRVTRLP